MSQLSELLDKAQAVLREHGQIGLAQAVETATAELRRHAFDGSEHRIIIGSILSSRTKRGAVELIVNRERVQMELPKAREVLGMLSQGIEAAVSDELLFTFLTTKVGLQEQAAAQALLDFRELRQGTREVSWPS